MVLEAKKEALPLLKLSEPRRCWKASVSGKQGMRTSHLHSLDPAVPKSSQTSSVKPSRTNAPNRKPSSGSQTTAPSKKTSLCKRDWEGQIVQRVSKSRDSEAVWSCSGLKKRQRHTCDWLLVKSPLATFAGCRPEPIIPALRIR